MKNVRSSNRKGILSATLNFYLMERLQCCIIIQIQAVRTNFFLSTVTTWWHSERERERDTSHKRQCWPYYTAPPTHAHGASCSVEDLNSSLPVKTQTYLLWLDPKNPTALFNGRTSTICLFKILEFLRTISTGYEISHPLNSLQLPTSTISCLGVYYGRWWLSYPFHTGVRVHQLTIAPELRDT